MKKIPQPALANRIRAGGFSLMEMLLVLGLVSALMAIGLMGTRKNWESQEVKASALKLAADLAMAPQLAAKLNRTVEIRFYKFVDPAIAHPMPQFRGYQLLERVEWENGPFALGMKSAPLYEMQRLEGTTIMANYTRYSTLLPPGQETAFVPGYDPDLHVGPYSYVAVEYRPDGTTNLPKTTGEPWFVTLTVVSWLDSMGLPTIFQCLGIDPSNGAVKIY